MQTLKIIGISAIVSSLIVVGLVQFYPLFGNDNLGIASLTDLSLGDTVSNFPAVYTANNTILENAINTIEGTTTNSTITTLSGLTTADSLATVGTLTSGSLGSGFTDVAVDRGGTGASSFDQYQIVFGSSTNPLFTGIGLGTNGQFLTSGGAGVLPSWTTSVINQALDYSFTSSYFGVDNLFATTSTTTGIAKFLSDVFVDGGIGTTTNGVIESSGDIYVGGGRIQNLGYEATSTTASIPTVQGNSTNVDLDCDTAGYKVISGGYSAIDNNANTIQTQVLDNHRLDDDTWHVEISCGAVSCTSGTFTVYAICLDI